MVKNNTKIDFKGKDFFIGFDTARKRWSVTIRYEDMELKTYSMNPSPEELVKYLHKNYPGGVYHTVYEAGYGGFWIHRRLMELGCDSMVVNPADIPTTHKDKDRKTDPVDSRKLARELSKGNLEAIYVPSEESQNLRLLSRHLRRCIQSQTRVKNRIKSLLSYIGISYADGTKKTPKSYIRWLQELSLDNGPARQTLQCHISELQEHHNRVNSIVKQIKDYCREIGSSDILSLLCTIPGIGLRTAITLYTEIIDINRFKKLDHLKAYSGLIPTTDSTGERDRAKGITKRRNVFLRHVLIEASWVAIRKDPALLQYYSKACFRMKGQQAIVRVAKKLLSRIRYVWKTGNPYECSIN